MTLQSSKQLDFQINLFLLLSPEFLYCQPKLDNGIAQRKSLNRVMSVGLRSNSLSFPHRDSENEP